MTETLKEISFKIFLDFCIDHDRFDLLQYMLEKSEDF